MINIFYIYSDINSFDIFNPSFKYIYVKNSIRDTEDGQNNGNEHCNELKSGNANRLRGKQDFYKCRAYELPPGEIAVKLNKFFDKDVNVNLNQFIINNANVFDIYFFSNYFYQKSNILI